MVLTKNDTLFSSSSSLINHQMKVVNCGWWNVLKNRLIPVPAVQSVDRLQVQTVQTLPRWRRDINAGHLGRTNTADGVVDGQATSPCFLVEWELFAFVRFFGFFSKPKPRWLQRCLRCYGSPARLEGAQPTVHIHPRLHRGSRLPPKPNQTSVHRRCTAIGRGFEKNPKNGCILGKLQYH